MANWFNRKLRVPSVKHSVFDNSHDYKTSFNIGQLVPNLVEDCVPSDKFLHLSADVFIRLAPLQFPIMHRLKVRQHYFQVPYRLILGDELYGQYLNDEIDLAPLVVEFANSGSVKFANTLLDYLGLDCKAIQQTGKNTYDFIIPNPIPIFAYNLIWANYFADEVLDEYTISTINTIIDSYRSTMASGGSLSLDYSAYGNAILGVKDISWSKDYFTAASTDTQRGESVSLLSSPLQLVDLNDPVAQGGALYFTPESGSSNRGFLQNYETLTNVTTADKITDLWKREMLQLFKQVDNVFGTRVFEKLAGHWGVISSDARIQKPRFLGGSQSAVQIQEVMSHSDTTGANLGAIAGKGISFSKTPSAKAFIEEHSFVLGLISLQPDNGYTNGNPRWFYKQNIYDTAIPEFNNIGYQPVYKGEVFASGNMATDKGDFAYQPRYSEYRVHNSIATGDFRTSLLQWHLNRNFASLPSFNANFVHITDSATNRIFQDTSGVKVYCDVWHNEKMSRPISYMPGPMHLY